MPCNHQPSDKEHIVLCKSLDFYHSASSDCDDLQYESAELKTTVCSHFEGWWRGISYGNLDTLDGHVVFSQSWELNTHQCTFNPTMTWRVTRGSIITENADLERSY